ncbi:MAG: T9SS type A sorting domain-containing protein [Sphingobacteriales bacterium JAD_PAG50586_3]|nr:MAG: T9SS type A sorting domain-containing protein [Sphingobacteriales bacterium JAD_PAG50586_3]
MKKLLLLSLAIIINTKVFCQTLTVNVVGFNPSEFDAFPLNYFKINDTIVDYDGYTAYSAIHIAVFDSTCTPWGTKWTDTSINPPVIYNPDHNFGQTNGDGIARNRAEYYFIFGYTGPYTLDRLDTMINSIPDGYTILLYSWQRSRSSFAQLNFPNFVNNVTNLGFANYLNTDSLPFIFVAKKGNPTSAQWVIGDSLRANITMDYDLGCASTSTFINNIKHSPLQVYPNPFNNSFTINLEDYTKPYTVLVYNSIGNCVYDESKIGVLSNISLANRPSGIYFYTLLNEEGKTLYKGKIVKQ